MVEEVLAKLTGGQVIGLVAVVGSLLLAASAIIAHHWRHVRVTEMQADLKRQMLGLGMNAADIEKVLQAPPPDGRQRGFPA
jgi:hypothetical protein